jgi:hypothetical protein
VQLIIWADMIVLSLLLLDNYLGLLQCIKEFAVEQLIAAEGAIEVPLASLYRKLEIANRAEAVARARQQVILP